MKMLFSLCGTPAFLAARNTTVYLDVNVRLSIDVQTSTQD